jgi:hypothetical protein
MISLSVMVRALRITAFGGLIGLCFLAGSGIPASAFALVGGLNVLFLSLFMRGALHLPRFLEPVKPIEPVLYRWVGVGLVKKIVATRVWPMMWGFEPPPKLKNRQAFLDRTELAARGAEICHATTFILALFVALIFLVVGRISEALWILGFNVLFNGYPVMLQRVHRWRLQQVRARFKEPNQSSQRNAMARPISVFKSRSSRG